MRRTFWFAAGAGASVYAMNRVRRIRETFTPDGLRDRAQALGLGARMLRDELTQGRLEKESELRERLGLPLPGTSRPAEIAARGAGERQPDEPTIHDDKRGTT